MNGDLLTLKSLSWITMVAGIGLLAGSPFKEAAATPRNGPSAMNSPTLERSVFWVGHSLVEQKAQSEWGEIDLMGLVGLFAKQRHVGYRSEPHALWGSPVSALWRGRPHSYSRDASAMVAPRKAFQTKADRYDTLVVTEALPIERVIDTEYSDYYIRLFYCALKAGNPAGRVFIYQTWVNLQAGDPGAGFGPPDRFDWRGRMKQSRRAWDTLAERVASGSVRRPTTFDRIGWRSMTDAGCANKDPVSIIPVGDVFLRLAERLGAPRPEDAFTLADGRRLAIEDLFSNPYIDWPENWPLSDGSSADAIKAQLASLTLRDPTRAHDDIHLSLLGIYMAALTHFATLYGQSPVGLMHPKSLGPDLARTLQCITWEVVRSEIRAHAGEKAEC